MTDYVPWLRKLAADGGKGVVGNIDARSLGRIADEIERLTDVKKQNPYAILGISLVTTAVSGARVTLEANPADLPNRLQEYAFYRMENASDAGDALLVNDLLAAAKLLRRS